MEEIFTNWMTESLAWIQASGWIGWVGFIALYALTCVFLLPGSVLTVGAGAVYGFGAGTLLVTIASVVGAVLNFATSRYLVHRWLHRKFAHNARFQALDQAIAKSGWRIVLLSRLSPILPHSIVSYACGLTTISMTRFTLASWIGFIPISAAYAYTGALIGKIAKAKAGLPHGIDSWLLYAAGLTITILVTIWSAKIAARALKTEIPLDPD